MALELVNKDDVKEGKLIGLIVVDKILPKLKTCMGYSIDNIDFILKECGAYILYRNGKMYIGSSGDVRRRVKNHTYKYSEEVIYGKISHIETFITRNLKDSKILERILIKELDPELNFCGKRGKCHIRWSINNDKIIIKNRNIDNKVADVIMTK